MSQRDSLGRATFDHIAPYRYTAPTQRELHWLRLIERHGPLSSQILHSATKQSHRCKDTALRALQKLRAQGLLRLPPQQRLTARAECNPYIYDLSPSGLMLLADINGGVANIRATGHWWHAFAVSSTTASIEIIGAKNNVNYLPTREVIGSNRYDLAIPVGGQMLRPDQVFALDYGGRFRVCALEVDRGTEPLTGHNSRKSLLKSIKLYEVAIERRAFNQAYGIKSEVLVLWLFVSETRRRHFLELVATHARKASQHILTMAKGGNRNPRFDACPEVFWQPWQRAEGEPVSLAVAE